MNLIEANSMVCSRIIQIKHVCYDLFLFASGAIYDYFVNSNAYRELLLFFYKLIFIYVFVN